MTTTTVGELELADWRREVAELHATRRHVAERHALCRAGRDRVFQKHTQSPLAREDPLRAGLAYAPSGELILAVMGSTPASTATSPAPNRRCE